MACKSCNDKIKAAMASGDVTVRLEGVDAYRFHVRQRAQRCAQCPWLLERHWLFLSWCGVPAPIRWVLPRLRGDGCGCCLTVKRRWPLYRTPGTLLKMAVVWLVEQVAGVKIKATYAENKCPHGQWAPMTHVPASFSRLSAIVGRQMAESRDNTGEGPQPRSAAQPGGENRVQSPRTSKVMSAAR